MTNDLKITYSHVFPDGYPITQSDVDELQKIRGDAINFMQELLGLHEQDSMYFHFLDRHLPSILISDEKPVRIYGLYSWIDIPYEIGNILDKYSWEMPSYIVELLHKLLELVMIRGSSGIDKEYKNEIARQIWEVAKQLADLLDAEEIDIEIANALGNLILHMKEIKHYAKRFGEFSGYNNLITIYSNNILDCCEKMNPLNLRATILGYMEIVLVHEMAHAFHFRYVGHNNVERIENWINLNTRPKGYKITVKEGFARWIEAEWCRKHMGEGKYSWRQKNIQGYSYDSRFDEILHEADTKSYPGWPYAAGSLIVRNPEIGHEIFRISSIIGSHGYEGKARWRNAYRCLPYLV